MTLFTGLDLGQVSDPTAMAVIDASGPVDERLCLVRHLERWPLGSKYTSIADDMEAMMGKPALEGSALIVDHTGVGRGVVDVFREKPILSRLHAVTITGGSKVTRENLDWHVPKKDLVAVVQVLLEAGRLKIAPQLAEAQTLIRELANFQMKITQAGNDTYGAWREGTHDDGSPPIEFGSR